MKAGIGGRIEYFVRGHLTNWLWRSDLERRIVRERVHMEVHTQYLKKYIPFIKSLKAPEIKKINSPMDENIYSIWLQGENRAPEIVKKCIGSLRNIYTDKYKLLSLEDLKKYIELPEFVYEKFKTGQISAAHFTDIARLDLIWRRGGYWSDATNFFTGPIPANIEETDFFMYVADRKLVPHMFVQNCFIRSRQAHPLAGMWRNLLLEFWRQEKEANYYFFGHMLFKLLVNHNENAKLLFENMPKISMEPTHRLWYEIGDLPYKHEELERLKNDAFFQKVSYKPAKRAVNVIKPGSMADFVLNEKIHGR